MDSGAAEAALGAWASVRGFFTPATLFLVVNLVIGTIALTSRSRRRGSAHDDHDAHGQQEPPPFGQAQQHQQHENQYYDQHQQEQHHEYVPAPPAPLARTSSVLDRLRSIGLYRFRSGDFPPEYATPVGTDSRDATSAPELASGDAHHARSMSEPAREESRRPAPSRMKKSSSVARRAEVPRAPAARVVRASVPEDEDDDVLHYTREDDEFTGGNSFTTQQQAPVTSQHEEESEEEEEEEHYYREEYVPPLRPRLLTRAPSVLERLRSFGLSRFRSGELAHEQTAAAVEELERNHAQKQQATQLYSRSRSEPSREQSKKGKKQQQESAEARMSKSGSVARKPAPAPVVAAEDVGGVDARADDFINTFRKQLQLQRLNSLLNYKEMINRGA